MFKFPINFFASVCAAGTLMFTTGCSTTTAKDVAAPVAPRSVNHDYDVAAVMWPSDHDEVSSHKFWPQGIGEWEVIKKGVPKFPGHEQPQVPLWGYKSDNDPEAVEQKIEAATHHGINTFIYDWYWYDGKPFLEEALNKGFLGAKNNHKMKFYIMWANHDASAKAWNVQEYGKLKKDPVHWRGNRGWTDFRVIVDRVINQYFKKPNYYKINGEPIFSLFLLDDFVNSFGGMDGAVKALDYFRDEVKKAGFPGLHFQVFAASWMKNPYLVSKRNAKGRSYAEIVKLLGINSVTMYDMGLGRKNEDYVKYSQNAVAYRKDWDAAALGVPFFPTVSLGWDNTLRSPSDTKKDVVHLNRTPENYGKALRDARAYVDAHPDQPRLVLLNAWNEWVEGNHLEPDTKWGYAFLEQVKKVFEEKEPVKKDAAKNVTP